MGVKSGRGLDAGDAKRSLAKPTRSSLCKQHWNPKCRSTRRISIRFSPRSIGHTLPRLGQQDRDEANNAMASASALRKKAVQTVACCLEFDLVASWRRRWNKESEAYLKDALSMLSVAKLCSATRPESVMALLQESTSEKQTLDSVTEVAILVWTMHASPFHVG